MKTCKYLQVAALVGGLFLCSHATFAQKIDRGANSVKKVTADDDENYNNAVGLRAGATSGITFKHYFDDNAVEGILGIWPYSLRFTALYEHYVSTGAKGLRWYYGGGGHVAIGSMYRTYYYPYENAPPYARYNYSGVGIGIDGVLGLEYKIPKIPFALSLDMKPFIEINNTPDIFLAWDPGFGIKFMF